MTKQKLKELITEAGALEFGDFLLKSGRRSAYYIDLRKVCFDDGVGWLASAILSEMIGCDAIGGPELGAVPIIGAVLALTERPLRGFAVRKQRKEHGKGDTIVGAVRPGDRCVVIDDVVTTGGSLLYAIEQIEAFGCSVVQAITVVDRADEVALLLAERNIPYTTLLSHRELMP